MLSCEQCNFKTEANEYLAQHHKALHRGAETICNAYGYQTDPKIS